jgi:hypothetical protein
MAKVVVDIESTDPIIKFYNTAGTNVSVIGYDNVNGNGSFASGTNLTTNPIITIGATFNIMKPLSMNSNNLSSVSNPANAQDAVTRDWLDFTGIIKTCRMTTTATGIGTTVYNNGTAGVGATLTASANGVLVTDGVTANTGDRVLIKNQTDATQNGIYVTTQAGSGSTPFILTRSTDADDGTKMSAGIIIFIEEGTSHAQTGKILATNNPIVIGTTALTFTQFTGLNLVNAGTGLSKFLNTLNVTPGDTTIIANADEIHVNPNLTLTTLSTSSTASIGTTSGALNMNSNQINNVTDPVSAQDIATKNYTDTQIATMSGTSWFGTGIDGNVTISVNTTLAADMYYNNLTVNNGITLNTGGFRIFVMNTLTNNGVIARNGNNAVGATAGAALSAGTLSGTVAGVAGATNANGTAGNSVAANSIGVSGTAGSASGTGRTGGAAGTAVAPTAVNGGANQIRCPVFGIMQRIAGTTTQLASSASSGSSASSAATVTGGASGSPGGIVVVVANIITGSGVISANGGNGGNATGTTGSAGGGPGSPGGVVFVLYNANTMTGGITSTGGTGGTAIGSGVVGGSGLNGVVVELQN